MTTPQQRALRRLPAAITVGVVAGLISGILMSVMTDLPLAPEAGVALGGFIAWRSRRDGH